MMLNFTKKRPVSSLLGLSLEGRRLEGVFLRRTNGSILHRKTFVAILSLDPLTSDSALVGREIRNHLEQAGIRERRCVVGIPTSWVLTLQTKLPDLPEADVASFLEIEAERGFPYGPEALLISHSRFETSAGEQYVTQAAVVHDHLSKLATALEAARLKPISFSLGLSALPGSDAEAGSGGLALAVTEEGIGLQLTYGGGVVALRSLEGVVETEGGQKRVDAELVARELRITLGQVPAGVRGEVHRLTLFGHDEFSASLAEELRPRVEPMGIEVQCVTQYSAEEFGIQLPKEAMISAAYSLAARHLARRSPTFEFRLPTSTAWERFTARYSSRKLAWAGATAGAVALLFLLTVIFQHWQISRLRTRWNEMSSRVTEAEAVQAKIRQFRPWFDDSVRTLSILRSLTEAFPEDGTLTAKTVAIRDLTLVSCAGSARDARALHDALEILGAAEEVKDVRIENFRGKAPLGQFTFDFRWTGGEGL